MQNCIIATHTMVKLVEQRKIGVVPWSAAQSAVPRAVLHPKWDTLCQNADTGTRKTVSHQLGEM